MIAANFIRLRIFVEMGNTSNVSCATGAICGCQFCAIYPSQLWSTFALLLSPLSSCPNHFCGEIRTAVELVLFSFSRALVSHCIT